MLLLFRGIKGQVGNEGAKGDHGDNFAIDYNFIGDKGSKGQTGERGAYKSYN